MSTSGSFLHPQRPSNSAMVMPYSRCYFNPVPVRGEANRRESAAAAAASIAMSEQQGCCYPLYQVYYYPVHPEATLYYDAGAQQYQQQQQQQQQQYQPAYGGGAYPAYSLGIFSPAGVADDNGGGFAAATNGAAATTTTTTRKNPPSASRQQNVSRKLAVAKAWIQIRGGSDLAWNARLVKKKSLALEEIRISHSARTLEPRLFSIHAPTFSHPLSLLLY